MSRESIESAQRVIEALKDPAMTVRVVTSGSATATLDRREAARFLGVSVDTLDRLHKLGKGPPAVLIGRRRVYTESKLQEWLDKGGQR